MDYEDYESGDDEEEEEGSTIPVLWVTRKGSFDSRVFGSKEGE
jgi:hypothetical protein